MWFTTYSLSHNQFSKSIKQKIHKNNFYLTALNNKLRYNNVI